MKLTVCLIIVNDFKFIPEPIALIVIPGCNWKQFRETITIIVEVDINGPCIDMQNGW